MRIHPDRWITNIFLIICIIFGARSAIGQNQELEAYFVKPVIAQEVNKLSFNILRIVNKGSTDAVIKPVLTVPKGWAYFSDSFHDTLVKANDTISLPFRFRIASKTNSEQEHHITFQGFSAANQLLLEEKFSIILEAFHSWDVVVPVKRFYFNPKMNIAFFEFKITNKGNTSEQINIKLETDKKAIITNESLLGINRDYVIAPHSDTTLRFEANFVFSVDRIFDISKIRIYAKGKDKRVFRSIHIEKYSDNYTPFRIDYNLPHSVESGIRTFSKNNEVLPFVKARGVTTFKNNSELKYNFTYYDLTQTEDIIGNSYYFFQYQLNGLKVGLGAFSSSLGRNLYNRNSVMVSQTISLGEHNSLVGYASSSFVDPNTSGAFGYIYQKNDYSLRTSVSYNFDGLQNRNTASFTLHSSRFKIFKKHYISGSLFSYHEAHSKKFSYTQFGVAWDLHYFSKLNEKAELHFIHQYGTPDIPGRRKGLLSFSTKLKYKSGYKQFFSFRINHAYRNFYQMSFEGERLPNIVLKDQYIAFLFHSEADPSFRWSIGPSAEIYQSSRPTTEPGIREYYKIRKYRLEFKDFIGRHLMINIKWGFSEMMHQLTDSVIGHNWDLHLRADYSKNGYGLQFNYDYGPLVNSGLYQFALDAGNHSTSISPYLIKAYFRGRIHMSLFANYTYRFDMKFGSLNINPKIDTYLFKNWYLSLGGTYNYVKQDFNGLVMDGGHYYIEASIKKKWGKSDLSKLEKELRRLKIQLFQDDNANGIKDRGEQGIPNVKVRIRLKSSPIDVKRGKLPVDLTLLSNEKGFVTFGSIPMGFYEIFLNPLSDLKEYFFIGQGIETVELTDNAMFFIPFQKSCKLFGHIELVKKRFKSSDEPDRDLSNIRITAFSQNGNSYAALTNSKGQFIIFAPGNNTYTLRMNNVFGDRHIILNNDLSIHLTQESPDTLVFKVAEKNKKVRFKKALKEDIEGRPIQKIKVLAGVVNQDSISRVAHRNALPQFDVNAEIVKIAPMKSGQYYSVLSEHETIAEARRLVIVYKEQGLEVQIGSFDGDKPYYIYSGEYRTRDAARKELGRLKGLKVKGGKVIH